MPQASIKIKLFDHLFNDPDLAIGGDVWPDGFLGVTRDRTKEANLLDVGDVYTPIDVSGTNFSIPAKGYINLFERPYNKDTRNARPAIYIGYPGDEDDDMREYKDASSGYLVEHRLLRVPLVIVTADSNYYASIAQRDQLRQNLRQVLRKHTVDPYWYMMRGPGMLAGGMFAIKNWATSTGGADQTLTEGFCQLPVGISYQDSKFITRA